MLQNSDVFFAITALGLLWWALHLPEPGTGPDLPDPPDPHGLSGRGSLRGPGRLSGLSRSGRRGAAAGEILRPKRDLRRPS
jgi:hypothetical protein